MVIAVYGLGYVGAVVMAALASRGHHMIGVDVDAYKVDLVRKGRSPIVEPGLEAMLAAGVAAGRIEATCHHTEAVGRSEMAMICVGTPSLPNGGLDVAPLVRVAQSIGEGMRQREKGRRYVVAVRSTVLPGMVEQHVIPVLEQASGLKTPRDFGVAINPEFLREGTALEDFFHPPKTVIGSTRKTDAARVASLYRGLKAPRFLTDLKTAAMVKYADNTFHALKVVFANEIGLLCRQLGVDAGRVMEIFCQDTRLNLSPAYLRPGFAFGGSCLPKDLRALTRVAREQEVPTPVLQAIAESNQRLIQRAAEWVLDTGKKRIGILGFAFKPGTDDLRESPMVALMEMLLGKGCRLKLYDPHVSLSRLIGANRRFIQERIPHLARLMANQPQHVLRHAELVILGTALPEFEPLLQELGPAQILLDLTPARRRPVVTPARYERLTG
ncbi:nucleotide sugar dehydrogenase [Fontisphaera persica]|uniref:nucleotide sugar dehydrogenase n=1 Tax=Fontisphaera persica TaxID=2974023 RepID=UPI0024BF872B|nr:nucleotide sugar dehydrogenase [Fontisphaera persica]WCJ60787.1 nucleotide sugar dehydrogenase [Fontisphaera persica]